MTALALERAQSAALPMRYLRMVPVWGMVAALMILDEGSSLFASRWSPATIALVHVFTLGVLGNAMLGSLLQFLPVVAGVRTRAPGWFGWTLPVLFNIGLAGLVCGLWQWRALIPWSGLCLALAIVGNCISALAGMHFDGHQTVLRIGLSLVLSSLLTAALLGLLLALGLARMVLVPMMPLADAHAAIGLLGGAVLLCGAVGSVVLPMFQGTARLPEAALVGWIGLLVGLLMSGAVLRLAGVIGGDGLARSLLAPVAVFAVAVVVLQWRAPHQRNRALVGFWRLGALALLAATLVVVAVPGARGTLLAGVLGVGIGLPALVLGMMLEIAAFLAWMELQRLRSRGTRVPGVDALLPETRKARLLAWHGLAALALLAATAWTNAATASLAALAVGSAYGLTLFELLALRHRTRRFARIVLHRCGALP